jgi:hypothetical protein
MTSSACLPDNSLCSLSLVDVLRCHSRVLRILAITAPWDSPNVTEIDFEESRIP